MFSLQKPGYRGYMTKTELLREAQPLSEKSFTMVSKFVQFLSSTSVRDFHITCDLNSWVWPEEEVDGLVSWGSLCKIYFMITWCTSLALGLCAFCWECSSMVAVSPSVSLDWLVLCVAVFIGLLNFIALVVYDKIVVVLQPDPGCHYTAWSSMGTLTKKGLVIKSNNPARWGFSEMSL